jgi:hypothetical protein
MSDKMSENDPAISAKIRGRVLATVAIFHIYCTRYDSEEAITGGPRSRLKLFMTHRLVTVVSLATM